jgi:hypothetical protein
MFPSHTRSLWRVVRLLLLLGAGIFVGWRILFPQAGMPPGTTRPVPQTSAQPSGGEVGAGGTRTGAALPALCNPFDPGCLLSGVASAAAQSIMNALSPVIDTFLKDPANIIEQTPPVDSYQNGTVKALNTLFVGVIDAALACLLVVGGYTIMIGSHLRMPQASLGELLARVVLVVGAVHFNLLFLGYVIDLENTLNQAIVQVTDYQILTNTIAGLLAQNPTAGLLLIILAIILGIMAIYLLIQMIARLALVDLLLALAPLGLGCLILPQTVRWGRLWLTSFAAALWVQLIQLAALGLGSIFLTAMTAPNTVFHGNVLATAFLAIGTLGLVLKIPSMLHHWALSPMWPGRQSSSGAGADDDAGSGDIGGSAESAAGGGGIGSGNIVEGTIVTEEAGVAADSTLLFLA